MSRGFAEAAEIIAGRDREKLASTQVRHDDQRPAVVRFISPKRNETEMTPAPYNSPNSASSVSFAILFSVLTCTHAAPPATEIDSDVVGKNVSALSPDGKLIAIGGYAGSMQESFVEVREVKSGHVIGQLGGAAYGISSIVFLRDGTGIVIGSIDGSLRIWDPAGGKGCIELLDGRGSRRSDGLDSVEMVAVTSDAKIIAESRRRNGITLWDVQKRAAIGTIEVNGFATSALEFSPNGKRLLVSGDADHTPSVWALKPIERKEVLLGHEAGPLFGAFSNDGKHIVTAGPSESTLRVWAADGEIKSVTKLPAGVDVFASSPGASLVALTLRDGMTALYSISSGKRETVLLDVGDGMEVLHLAFSGDGKHLAAVGKVRNKSRVVVFHLTDME